MEQLEGGWMLWSTHDVLVLVHTEPRHFGHPGAVLQSQENDVYTGNPDARLIAMVMGRQDIPSHAATESFQD